MTFKEIKFFDPFLGSFVWYEQDDGVSEISRKKHRDRSEKKHNRLVNMVRSLC